MHEVIRTGIGYVTIESSENGVVVTFKQSVGESVVSSHKISENSVAFSIARVPSPSQEITQNGSTFEVIDVRRNGDGYDVLNGNTGVWEKWVED